MKDRIIRFCSLVFTLAFIAGWAAFGQHTGVASLYQADRGDEVVAPSVSYHDTQLPDLTLASNAEACVRCHPGLPHRKTAYARAFLNLHIGRFDCMVCHLEKEKRHDARWAWFEWSGARLSESSAGSTTAFLAPYFEDSGAYTIVESRTGGEAAEVSDEGKHVVTLDAPVCAACHSPGGRSFLKNAGYGEEELNRLENMQGITKFTEGKEFYYTRF